MRQALICAGYWAIAGVVVGVGIQSFFGADAFVIPCGALNTIIGLILLLIVTRNQQAYKAFYGEGEGWACARNFNCNTIYAISDGPHMVADGKTFFVVSDYSNTSKHPKCQSPKSLTSMLYATQRATKTQPENIADPGLDSPQLCRLQTKS